MTLLAVTAVTLMGAPALAAGPGLQPLSLAKECSKFAGHPGDICTITKSSLAAIPAGSKVVYYGPILGPDLLASTILLDAGDGNTAIGSCNVDLPKSSGACTFWAGSGTLQGFTAMVNLTIDGTGLFHWDGGYAIAASSM